MAKSQRNRKWLLWEREVDSLHPNKIPTKTNGADLFSVLVLKSNELVDEITK